ACQFDESRVEVPLLGLPRQIEGIDGNAVSPAARPRIKRVESERFCRSRFNHFPDVQVHPQTQELQLIYQRDIYAAVDILKQLGHLRSSRGSDLDGAVEDGSIEQTRKLRCLRAQPADDFRNVTARHGLVSRVLALR